MIESSASANRLERVTEWFVPHQTGPNAEDVTRRARLLLAVLALCAANLIFTSLVHAYLGNSEFAIGIALALPVAGAIALAMKSGASIHALTHTTVACIYLVSLGVALVTGGRIAGGLFFLVLVPAVAILIVDRRAGLAWTGMTIATLVALSVFEADDAPWVALHGLDAQKTNLRAAGLVALAVTALAAAFSALHQRANDALHDLVGRHREGERRFRAITEHAYDLIAELDRDGRFIFASPGFEEALGWKPEELVGVTVRDRLHPEDLDRAQAYWSQLMDKGLVRQDPVRLLTSTGNSRWFEITMRTYCVDEGELRVVTVSRDVTERRNQERLLRRQHRLVAGGTMTAGVAHQLNNPLGSILAAAQYANQFKWNSSFGDLAGESIDAIEEEAKRCARILRSILAFSRGEDSERWTEDVKHVLYRAVRAVQAEESGIATEIVLSLPRGEVPVVMSPIEIEQVVINLLRNAVQAGAAVAVVGLDVKDRVVEISVSDDGPGLGDTTEAEAFSSFFTTRVGTGSGLGLTVAKEIIENHGGTIRLVRSDEDGAIFRCTLPFANADTP